MTADHFDKAYGLDYREDPSRPFRYEAPATIRGTIYAGCSIGAHSYINGGMVRERTHIGRFCSIAYGVSLGVGDHALHLVSTHPFASRAAFDMKHDSPYASPSARPWDQPTRIGHDVWIGTNVVLRGGTTVGIGAVLAAGAIVITDVPPYAIMGGVPAKVLRYRFPEELRRALLASEWWEYPVELLTSLPTNNIELFLKRLEESKRERAVYTWFDF